MFVLVFVIVSYIIFAVNFPFIVNMHTLLYICLGAILYVRQYDVASHACIANYGIDSPDEKFHLDLHEKFSVIYYMRNMAFFRSLPLVRMIH